MCEYLLCMKNGVSLVDQKITKNGNRNDRKNQK